MAAQKTVLVIKLSALGDFIQAMGPFAAIRRHHADDRIILLTTKPYVELAEKSPYFDEVWVDSRPKPWQVTELMRLRRKLRSVKFSMVYDLQTSDRSSSYYHMMDDPPWSGIAHGCTYPHANPDRDFMHTIERQAEQLAMAGIAETPLPDLSWAQADVAHFGLPGRYALLVPGGAPHRPAKRWPAAHFADLANRLAGQGVTPVLVGTNHDADQIDAVLAASPRAMSLMGQTGFVDIAVLARGAAGAVGNDTGPMHIIAAAGCPAVVLFSAESDPKLCAPRGPQGHVAILVCDDLADMSVETVASALADGPAALRS